MECRAAGIHNLSIRGTKHALKSKQIDNSISNLYDLKYPM